MLAIKKHPFFIKWSNWEYWPMYILYIPVCLQHLWLSVKAGNPFFFLTTNPAINEGFILSDSKFNTLQLVPEAHRPLTLFVAKNESAENILHKMQENNLRFPIVLKPDIGYRGLRVHRIDNKEQLMQVAKKLGVPYIIQEYIDYDLEVGIFYYRFPNSNSGHIPSITIKEFLSVTGTGKHTMAALVAQNPRAILQKDKLKKKFAVQWNQIIEKDIKLILEPIGNHNRGTKFVNGATINDSDLLTTFNSLNGQMKGFYYGRFDIKVNSIEDLKQGQNFKILEVNGVGAEPTHIYDPGYKIINGWKELMYLWRVVFKIAAMHKKAGLPYSRWTEGTARFRNYIKYTREFKNA